MPALHEAGRTQTVAALGTSFSADHVQAISGFAKNRIICLFDGDAAGQRAAERAVQFMDKTRLDMVCVVLPANGEKCPRCWNWRELGSDGLAALDSLAEVLAPLGDSVLLDGYVAQVAQLRGLSTEEARRRIRARQTRRGQQAPSAPEPRPVVAPMDVQTDLSALSSDERFAVTAERELLALMATAPDAVRPYGERMAGFTWSD